MDNLENTHASQAGDFLAGVSHELRTPLNAVLGMLELALGEPLSATQRDYLTTALRSARSLAISLEELCDLAYIESDTFVLAQTPVDLAAIVWRSIRSLRLPARERGINLSVDIHSDVPPRVLGDAWRLQQIVMGLAQHAIQTATSTRLTVELANLGPTADGVELLLRVGDGGTSIAPQTTRTPADHPANTSRYATAGLALSIARRLAERMDGHLWVEQLDSGGEGRMGCLVRLQPADEEPLSPPEAQYASGYGAELEDEPHDLEPVDQPLRVLVVDDTPANRQVVKAILDKRGHQVALAANGLQAVERVRRQPFDVVLMDAQMPTLNGLEATEAIRRLPDPVQASVPIIAMTAHALRDDRQRCLASGMNDYLSKPVEMVDLLERVEHHGRARQALVPAETPREPAEGLSPADQAQAMLRRFGDDRSLLVALIRLFREGLPELLAALAGGLADGDAEVVGRAAHNLRGVAANFDDEAVNAALKQIEQLARAGDLAAVPQLVQPLEAQLAALVTRLDQVAEHFSADEASS